MKILKSTDFIIAFSDKEKASGPVGPEDSRHCPPMERTLAEDTQAKEKGQASSSDPRFGSCIPVFEVRPKRNTSSAAADCALASLLERNDDSLVHTALASQRAKERVSADYASLRSLVEDSFEDQKRSHDLIFRCVENSIKLLTQRAEITDLAMSEMICLISQKQDAEGERASVFIDDFKTCLDAVRLTQEAMQSDVRDLEKYMHSLDTLQDGHTKKQKDLERRIQEENESIWKVLRETIDFSRGLEQRYVLDRDTVRMRLDNVEDSVTACLQRSCQ